MRRTTIFVWLLASVPACASLVGVDGDYHEADETTDASAGGTNAGGASTTGGTGGGGVTGGTGGVTGGTGGVTGGTGGVTDGGGSGGTAGSTSCSSLGKLCAAAVPGGFTGPVTLQEAASAPPACPAGYPTDAALDLHADLTANPATCDCNCGAPSINCPGPALYQGVSSVCASGAYVETLVANVCEAITVPAGNRIEVWQPVPTFGACASTSNHTIPSSTWNLEGRACGGAATDGTCQSGEVCVPPPPSGEKLCVYQTGDVSCPAGYYSDKHLFHQGSSDTRDCSPCSCGGATGECKGTVVFTSSCSSTTASGSLSLGACGGPFTNVGAARYTPGTHTGTCAPAGGVLTGSVTPTNPVTLCCAP